MISSVVVKKDSIDIDFIKVDVDLMTNKLTTKIACYEVCDDLKEHVLTKHRVYIPCNITVDPDFTHVPYSATVYVPLTWDNDAIENYIQALLDELYLYNNNIEGHKTLKQIENSFMLEIIIL